MHLKKQLAFFVSTLIFLATSLYNPMNVQNIQASNLLNYQVENENHIQLGGYFMPYATESQIKLMFECGLDYMLVDSWNAIKERDENGHYIYNDGIAQTYSPSLNSVYLGKVLEWFDKYDMKALINLSNNKTTQATSYSDITVDYTQYNSFMGFDVIDEPDNATLNGTWMQNQLTAHNSGKYSDYLFGVTLCRQSSGFDSFVSNYVSKYLSKVSKKVMVFDDYPFVWNKTSGEASIQSNYLSMFDKLADTARDNNATFCSYVQTLEYSGHRYVTKADLEYQINVGLAFGCSDFRFFTVYTPQTMDGTEIPDAEGIISNLGYPTRTYYNVQEVNNELKTFDNVLLDYTWQGTMSHAGWLINNGQPLSDISNSLTTSSRVTAMNSKYQMLVGVYKNTSLGNQDAYYVMNYSDPSYGLKNNVYLTFNDATKAIVYRNGNMAETVNLANGEFTARLDEGEGILVVPCN